MFQYLISIFCISESRISLNQMNSVADSESENLQNKEDNDAIRTTQPHHLEGRSRLITALRSANVRTVSHHHSSSVRFADRDDVNSSVLNLRLRDLRRLDFSINPNEELTVQVRRHVVLFSVDPIRAIITHKKLRIIVPPGADSIMKFLEDYMQGKVVMNIVLLKLI